MREPGGNLSRRDVLKTFAVGAKVLLLTPLVGIAPGTSRTSAEALPPGNNRTETPYNWPYIHKMAVDLQNAEVRRWAQAPVEKLRKGLEELETVAEPFANRHRKIVALLETQPAKDGLPPYLALAQDLRGAMQHIGPEDHVPSYKLAGNITDNIVSIQKKLEGMVSQRQSKPEVNLEGRYADVGGLVDEGIEYCTVQSPEQAKDGCSVIVSMDPTIKSTTFGNSLFKMDAKTLEKTLAEAYPGYQDTCSEFILSGSAYGERPLGGRGSSPGVHGLFFTQKHPEIDLFAQQGVQGLFFSQKPPGTRLYAGYHWINMDEIPSLGKHTRGHVVRHEAGHGADALVSQATAYRLTPTQLVEAMRLNQAVTLHPDWGAHDRTLPQLFERHPYPKDLVGLLEAVGEAVDPATLVALIRGYPIERSLVPKLGLEVKPEGNGFSLSLKPYRLIDFALGDPKPNHPNYQDIKWPTNLKPEYNSLGAFAADIMPSLASQADSGNIRAKVLYTGLGEFGDYLARTDLVPEVSFKGFGRFVPGSEKDADTWRNYCNFIASDATFYHLLVNGSIGGQDLRQNLTSEQQKSGEEMVLDLRYMVQNEVRAEGMAFDAALGNRLDPTNPYRMIRAQFGLFFNRA